MKNVNSIIADGKALRDKGLIRESITLIYKALDEVSSDVDKSLLRIQLGLSHLELRDFNMAYRQFDLALAYGKRADKAVLVFDAKRYISIPLLHMGKHEEALRMASEALGEARKWKVPDVPCFTQACVDIVLKMNTTKAQKREWLRLELVDLVSFYIYEPDRKVRFEWLRHLLKHSWVVFWSK